MQKKTLSECLAAAAQVLSLIDRKRGEHADGCEHCAQAGSSIERRIMELYVDAIDPDIEQRSNDIAALFSLFSEEEQRCVVTELELESENN